jgi:hypothetical protein
MSYEEALNTKSDDLKMGEFRTGVNGMICKCKSDGSATIEEECAHFAGEVVFRGFIEFGGKRYVLNEIGGFRRLSDVERIFISNTVEKIRSGCFSGCAHLHEVMFESGSNLKEISGYAFSNCGIKSIQVPNTVEKIGASCFNESFIMNANLFLK